MPRRTTIQLDNDVYERLVKESLTRYGTVRAISKVLNEILRKSFRDKGDILHLIYSEKVASTTAKEFERFRRDLSKRLES